MSDANPTAPADLTDEQLEAIIGPIAMREYLNAYDTHKPRLREWFAALPTLTDDEFVRRCESAILESARMSSFRGNFDDLHCMASACYTEARRRYIAAGHNKDCRGSSLYDKAYRRAYRSQGHTPPEPYPCTCGKEE